MTSDIISMSSLTTSGLRRSLAAASRKFRKRKTETCQKHDQLDWKSANQLALKASCKLKMPSGDSVAGTLFDKESDGRHLHLFISTNRRLSIQSPDDLLNATLHLSDLQPDKHYISLDSGKVLNVWHTSPRNEHRGNTIVELTDKAAEECRSSDAHFLKIGTALPNEEVVVWFWWPLATQTPVLLFKPRAIIESVNDNGLTLLLGDVPESIREMWGERGSQLLHQLYGGSSVILINKIGEAVAMDTLLKVSWNDEDDINFASCCDIDTNQQTYPFKSTVLPLVKLLKQCQPHVENDSSTIPIAPNKLQEVSNKTIICASKLLLENVPSTSLTPIKLQNEFQGLSKKEHESALCKVKEENTVNSVICKNILCASHISQTSLFSFCESKVFNTQSNGFVSPLITKLESGPFTKLESIIQCLKSGLSVPRKDLSTYKVQCGHKQNRASSNGAKYLQKVRLFASMA